MPDEKPPTGKPGETPRPLPQRPDPSLVQIIEKGADGPKITKRG